MQQARILRKGDRSILSMKLCLKSCLHNFFSLLIAPYQRIEKQTWIFYYFRSRNWVKKWRLWGEKVYRTTTRRGRPIILESHLTSYCDRATNKNFPRIEHVNTFGCAPRTQTLLTSKMSNSPRNIRKNSRTPVNFNVYFFSLPLRHFFLTMLLLLFAIYRSWNISWRQCHTYIDYPAQPIERLCVVNKDARLDARYSRRSHVFLKHACTPLYHPDFLLVFTDNLTFHERSWNSRSNLIQSVFIAWKFIFISKQIDNWKIPPRAVSIPNFDASSYVYIVHSSVSYLSDASSSRSFVHTMQDQVHLAL